MNNQLYVPLPPTDQFESLMLPENNETQLNILHPVGKTASCLSGTVTFAYLAIWGKQLPAPAAGGAQKQHLWSEGWHPSVSFFCLSPC